MEKKDTVEQSKRFTAKFSESIFFSIKNIENKMQNVQKNNFFFSFCDSQKINICNENDAINNPRIYIQGLDKLFDMSATSGNDNPMVGFAKALISSDSDWEIEYIAETKDYGNNCLKISKNNIPSENINGTDTQPEQDLNITIQLIEPYLFDAIFTDYEAIKVTVHFVDFDDNDKDIEQDYIITAKEVAFVDEIKLYDANGNEANAIPHGEKASLQWYGGNINKCKVSLQDEFGVEIKIKNAADKTDHFSQEADLPTIDHDRIFTLNLEKDDRTTTLKVSVVEAPYVDDFDVFDSESNRVKAIYKGDTAIIKWFGGNAEKSYLCDEKGNMLKESSPNEIHIQINEDQKFTLNLVRKNISASQTLAVYKTQWKKELVYKTNFLYPIENGNKKFFYHPGGFSCPAGYYIYSNSKIMYSNNLVEWNVFMDTPVHGNARYTSVNLHLSKNTLFWEICHICNDGIYIDKCDLAEKDWYEIKKNINDFKPTDINEELSSIHIIQDLLIAVYEKQIYFYDAKTFKVIRPFSELDSKERIIALDTTFQYNLCFIVKTDSHIISRINYRCLNNYCVQNDGFKFEENNLNEIYFAKTNHFYVISNNHMFKRLDDPGYVEVSDHIFKWIASDGYVEITDNHFSPLGIINKEKKKNTIVCEKDSSKFYIIVQDDKETSLWSYNE